MRILLAAMLVLAVDACAQRSRYTSPKEETSTSITGKSITVEYYAPSMHGRKVFGALVPFGQVWCTGANWATKLTTESDLQVGDLRLPKGSYSLWTVPYEKDWTLVINRETGQFHLNYDQTRDFGRTRMELKTLPAPVDKFTVALKPEGGDSGRLALIWENTEASVPFKVLK